MTTQLDVTLRALQHLNERWDNVDTTTDGIGAEQINLVFDVEFQKLVTTYPWTFAVRWEDAEAVTVATAVTLPAPWLAALPYPTGASKVLGLPNPLGENYPALTFRVAWFDYDDDGTDEQVILCTSGDNAVRYISSAVDITDADEHFCDALSYILAARVCLSVTGSDALKRELQAEAVVSVTSAMASDAIEGAGPDQDRDPDWLQAR